MLHGALKIRTRTRNVPPSAAWEKFAIFANCAKTTCQIVSILTDFDSALKNNSEYVPFIENNPYLKNISDARILARKSRIFANFARAIILGTARVRKYGQKYVHCTKNIAVPRTFENPYRELLRDQTTLHCW